MVGAVNIIVDTNVRLMWT